jgi:hypothetical protein
MRLLSVLTVLALVGCGGGDGGEQASPTATRTTPEQDAGDFMKELYERQLRGQYGRVWESLHPSHKAVVSREEFDACTRQNDGGGTRVTVSVVETYDEPVRALGSTHEEGESEIKDSTAVTLRFNYSNPLTGKPAEEHATVHAVAIGGEWRWILSPESFNAYVKGECPED